MKILHDEQQLIAGSDDIDHTHDIGVTHARCEACLIDEQIDELALVHEVWTHALDRDRLRETCSAALACKVHGRHSTNCDGLAEDIAVHLKDRRRRCHRREIVSPPI